VVEHDAAAVCVGGVSEFVRGAEPRWRPPDVKGLEAGVERDALGAQRLDEDFAREAEGGGVVLEAEFVEGGGVVFALSPCGRGQRAKRAGEG